MTRILWDPCIIGKGETFGEQSRPLLEERHYDDCYLRQQGYNENNRTVDGGDYYSSLAFMHLYIRMRCGNGLIFMS